MKLIENLNILEIGDWIKVDSKDYSKKYFKIGEITNKWIEKNNPHFELKVFETNLPLSTQQLIQRIYEIKHWRVKKYTKGKCSDKDMIFKLDKKEKSNLLKKMIVEGLK